ncbi:MAG: tetratricopeptide repeat protein [Gammaproteobacteria bacterium]
MRGLIAELRRRRVFRTLALYAVAGWVVIQVAQAAFEAWDVPMPLLRWVWIGLVLASPAVLVFAWSYDIVGGRVVRTPPKGADESADLSLRPVDFGLLAALGLVVGAVVFGLVQRAEMEHAEWKVPTAADARPAIAVMPFIDLTADAAFGYFGDGLAASLLTQLGRIVDMDVIARTSSFHFRDTGGGISEIAEALDVDYLVEGSVSRERSEVHASAALIDARTGRQLWSGTFAGSADEPFETQQRIAEAVAGYLGVSLGDPRRQGGTTSFEAYDAFLRSWDAESEELEVLLLDEALAHDPDFAQALVAKAWIPYLRLWRGIGSPEDAWREAEPLLDRALAVTDELPWAHVLIGGYATFRGDLEAAEAAFLRALEINPSFTPAYEHLSRLYMMTGRPRESVAMAERNVRLDPMVAMYHVQLANRYLTLGEVDRAIESFERAIEIDPRNAAAWTDYAGRLGMAAGRYVDAFAVFARMLQVPEITLPPRTLGTMGLLFSMVGDDDRAMRLAELQSNHGDSFRLHQNLAARNYALGHLEDARREARLALEGQKRNALAGSVLISTALETGEELEETLAWLRATWPGLLADPPELKQHRDAFVALPAALLLRLTGDARQASRLLDAVAADPESDPVQAALASAHQGRVDEAIGRLDLSEQPRGLESLAAHSPVWAPLAGDPRFQSMLEARMRELDGVREEIDTMIEAGELPLQVIPGY